MLVLTTAVVWFGY